MAELFQSEPILKVQEFQGEFSMDAHSDIFFRLMTERNYEAELVDFCKKYLNAERDVIDIGANIGFYTVMFAKRINSNRKVLSIEPINNAIRLLKLNIKANNVIEKVEVFEGVASDKAGILTIKTIKNKEEFSTLGSMKHPSVINEPYETEEVMSSTIDELIFSKALIPGFIKIDVEGSEYLVIKGACRVLKEFRPILLSELSDYLLKENGSSSREVIEMIKKHDYDVFDPIDGTNDVGWKKFGDIVCFPKEMGIKFEP
jgi:FkbM family methyltransferase